MLLFKLVEEALGVGFEVSQAHKSVALNNKVVIFSESYFEKEDLVKTIHIIQEKMTNSHEDFEFQRNEL